MNLSGQQRKNLLAALNDAFRDKASLEQMLAFELDKNLDTIAGGNSLQDIVFNLIKTAESQGWVEDLVCAARRFNSGNLKLRAIILRKNLNSEFPTHSKMESSGQGSVFFEARSREEICENSDILNRQDNVNFDDCSKKNKLPKQSKFTPIRKHIIDNNSNYNKNYTDFIKLESKHNYPNLILINIQIICLKLEKDLQQFNLLLDISFGEVEENFKYKEKLGFVEKEGYVKFGIKFGELCFKLTNGCMPLNLRRLPKIEQAFGLGASTGTDEYPRWQFRVNDKKRSTLFGSITDQELGIMLLEKTYCLVETTFQVNVNSNNLGVIEQEGVWDDETNKKVKETKIRAFFKKVVEPKIKDYVSKVVLQYDSTTNS